MYIEAAYLKENETEILEPRFLRKMFNVISPPEVNLRRGKGGFLSCYLAKPIGGGNQHTTLTKLDPPSIYLHISIYCFHNKLSISLYGWACPAQ